jgi:hypothetical protein
MRRVGKDVGSGHRLYGERWKRISRDSSYTGLGRHGSDGLSASNRFFWLPPLRLHHLLDLFALLVSPLPVPFDPLLLLPRLHVRHELLQQRHEEGFIARNSDGRGGTSGRRGRAGGSGRRERVGESQTRESWPSER